jgi:DNA primase
MPTDLLSMVECDGFRTVRKSMSRGGQYNGPCPWCQGTDRFRVQPHYGPYGFFACSQCGRSGSAVDYLMQKRGLSKQVALAEVGWMPKDGSIPSFLIPASAHEERPRWNDPPQTWQDAAIDFSRQCQRLLWSQHGAQALSYLRGRGLCDKVIKGAMLGYHPSVAYGPAHLWGRAVKLPQGIVIPWFITGKLWRVTIRDETIVQGSGRYTQIAGGSNGLYLAESLRLKRSAVVLVEGEFDALSLAQECGDLVAVVATGTTQGSHTPRWIVRLSSQRRVLVAFDAEEQGDRAATWWMERLENAQRLRPVWKDVNQMLQDGAGLRTWVASALFPSAAGAASDPQAPRTGSGPATYPARTSTHNPPLSSPEAGDRVMDANAVPPGRETAERLSYPHCMHAWMAPPPVTVCPDCLTHNWQPYWGKWATRSWGCGTCHPEIAASLGRNYHEQEMEVQT